MPEETRNIPFTARDGIRWSCLRCGDSRAFGRTSSRYPWYVGTWRLARKVWSISAAVRGSVLGEMRCSPFVSARPIAPIRSAGDQAATACDLSNSLLSLFQWLATGRIVARNPVSAISPVSQSDASATSQARAAHRAECEMRSGRPGRTRVLSPSRVYDRAAVAGGRCAPGVMQRMSRMTRHQCVRRSA